MLTSSRWWEGSQIPPTIAVSKTLSEGFETAS